MYIVVVVYYLSNELIVGTSFDNLQNCIVSCIQLVIRRYVNSCIMEVTESRVKMFIPGKP